jgi:glucose-1-phosphate cytidylyltransferase
MSIFAAQGIEEFLILAGYKGHLISEFFLNFRQRNSDFEIDFSSGKITYFSQNSFNWKVTVVDTGLSTMTGGRLLRAKPFLHKNEPFYFTYGDGLANVDLRSVLSLNQVSNTVATVTAVMPPSRFGKIGFEGLLANQFSEKPVNYSERINGGFFVLRPSIFGFLSGDSCVFEDDPLKRLVDDQELSVYQHDGYWSCLDTLRDLEQIQSDARLSPVPWLQF